MQSCVVSWFVTLDEYQSNQRNEPSRGQIVSDKGQAVMGRQISSDGCRNRSAQDAGKIKSNRGTVVTRGSRKQGRQGASQRSVGEAAQAESARQKHEYGRCIVRAE